MGQLAKLRAGWIVVGFIVSAAAGFAELGDTASPSPDHPAISYFNYLKHTLRDPVSELNRKLQQGALQLRFLQTGFLPRSASHIALRSFCSATWCS